MPHRKFHILYLATETEAGTTGAQGRTSRAIDEALNRSRNRDRFILQQAWAGRKLDIARAIMDQEVVPEILHFSAGNASKTGIVMVEEEIPSQGLRELFRNYPGTINCVLFDMADSATLAEQVSQEVSYTIGFDGALTAREIEAFVVGFYDGLGRQEQLNIPDAFDRGKIMLSLESGKAASRELPKLFTDPAILQLQQLKQELYTQLQEARIPENRLIQTFNTVPEAVEVTTDAIRPRTGYIDIRKAFEEHARRLLVLGDPGSGKSLVLAEFTFECLQRWEQGQTNLLPVVISLRGWTPEQNLYNWLKGHSRLLPDRFERLRERKRLLLVLDDLDELPDHVPIRADGHHEILNYREAFVEAWKEEVRFRSIAVLMSCRRAEYESLTRQYLSHKLNLAGAVLIQPLKDDAVRQYLERAHQDLGCQPLIEAIQTDRKLKQLVRSPQFLVIVSDTYFQQRDAWVERQIASQNLRYEALEMFLESHYRRLNQPPVELTEWEELAGRGIFNMMADFYHEDSALEEAHLQDFLPKDANISVREFFDLAERLHLLEPAFEDSPAFRFRNTLLRDHLVLPIAREKLLSTDEEERLKAVVILGKLGDLEYVPELIPLQLDPDPWVRYELAFVLGKLRTEAAKECLKVLLGDEDPDVQVVSIRSLVRYGDPEVVEAIALMLFHEDRFVKVDAIKACGELGGLVEEPNSSLMKRVVDQLQNLQQLDGVLEVRETAAEVLEQLGTTAKGPFSLQVQDWITAQEDSKQLWVAAVYILVSYGFDINQLKRQPIQEVELATVGQMLVEGLMGAVNHPTSPGIRELAATSLGNLGIEVAITDLGRVLREDRFSSVRNAAKAALFDLMYHPNTSESGKERVRRGLRTAGYDKELPPSDAPIASLSIEKNLEILRNRAGTEAHDRFVAAQAIGELGRAVNLSSILDSLRDCLNDPSPVVVAAVVQVIGKIGVPVEGLLPQLIEMCNRQDRFIRKEACLALGRLFSGSFEVQNQLIEELMKLWRNDPISEVREAAEEALLKAFYISRNERLGKTLRRVGLVQQDPTHRDLSQ